MSNKMHYPNCCADMVYVGFTGYRAIIFNCPLCWGQYEIKTTKSPHIQQSGPNTTNTENKWNT